MDEQARATFILAAATLTAAQMQGHHHTDAEAVEHLINVLREMEAKGITPAGVDAPSPKTFSFRSGKIEQS